MRILVYPHELIVGGSQLNAIEIAGTLHARGHETIVFGHQGPLVERVAQLGMEYVEAPPPGRRPSPPAVRALTRLVDSRRLDILHGYEWPPALDGVLAARLRPGVTPVATIMSMSVAPFLPRSLDLVVGTEQIAAREAASGRTRTSVIEPPVDLAHDAPPSLAELEAFRSRWMLTDDRLTIVCVTRLVREMKLEGVLAAMHAVGGLAATHPVRLVVVGGGPAAADAERLADEVNARAGARVIVLTGELADPRPAYAVADVALGMGGSALRALAHGAPLVVQGEQGFWKVLTPETLGDFLWTGWYGYGSSQQDGIARLRAALVPLLVDAALRRELARFGQRLVHDRFSLEHAADSQLAVYERALERRGGPRLAETAVAAGRFGRNLIARRLARTFGRNLRDFSTNPVAKGGPVRPSSRESSTELPGSAVAVSGPDPR